MDITRLDWLRPPPSALGEEGHSLHFRNFDPEGEAHLTNVIKYTVLVSNIRLEYVFFSGRLRRWGVDLGGVKGRLPAGGRRSNVIQEYTRRWYLQFMDFSNLQQSYNHTRMNN